MDKRQFRLIRLPNNLIAVCVHDPGAKKAAAALSVNVGSSADPEEFLGLAHFCEHLLFMGSKKYPKEDEYQSYIANNGGSTNASTSFQTTSYHFHVAGDSLEGALDRFAQFFVSPLFSADCVGREVRAVDSEFKSHLQDDKWRGSRIKNSTSNPSHPYSRFHTGSIDTLEGAAERLGVDLRDELVRFYERHYSADIMKLVVVGHDSLDQLTEWAVAKFSEVLSKGTTKSIFGGLEHPLSENELGTVVRYKTISERYTIKLCFALPDMQAAYLVDPVEYVSSLISHRGHGSILSCLKRRGWATKVTDTIAFSVCDGFNILTIEVAATPEGFKHYDDITRAVFAYIQLLESRGPQEWYYKELQRACSVNFKFSEPSRAQDLAVNMVKEMQNRFLLPSHIITAFKLYRRYDVSMISSFVGLLNPDNFRIYLGARDFGSIECTEKEEFYGVDYRIDRLPQSLVRDLHGELRFDELHFPDHNQFLPEILDVQGPALPPCMPATEPTLLKLTDAVEVWFKRDDQFLLPRGSIHLYIENPVVYESPLTRAISGLYTFILNSIIQEEVYGAIRVGMRYEFRSADCGIQVVVRGFSDKLPLLLETILRAARTFQADKKQFEMYLNQKQVMYSNMRYIIPRDIANWNSFYLGSSPHWTFDEMRLELENVTIERLQSFADCLFDSTRVKMCMVGNFVEEDALAAASRILETLGTTPLPAYMRTSACAHDIQPGTYIHQISAPDKDNINSAVSYVIYAGLADNWRERTIISLLAGAANKQFFAQIRGKEQLGYMVSCLHLLLGRGGRHCLRLLVQSECSPVYLVLRIDNFLRLYREQIANMTDEEFEILISSRIQINQRKPKGINEEACRFWSHIDSGFYEFDRPEAEIEELRSLTKGDLLEFWDKYINAATAPRFARVISQVCIALFGCLHREGATEFTLEEVDALVNRMSLDGASKNLDKLAASSLETLRQQYAEIARKAVDSGHSTKSHDEIANVCQRLTAKPLTSSPSHIKTALAMAISAARVGYNRKTAGDISHYANIGMTRTRNGSWVIKDCLVFKRTQPLLGLPIPTRKLVPKY
ncbi:hypothetical protein GQ54DRAFT_280568, partial [Martensiomyces pterosporus]